MIVILPEAVKAAALNACDAEPARAAFSVSSSLIAAWTVVAAIEPAGVFEIYSAEIALAADCDIVQAILVPLPTIEVIFITSWSVA